MAETTKKIPLTAATEPEVKDGIEILYPAYFELNIIKGDRSGAGCTNWHTFKSTTFKGALKKALTLINNGVGYTKQFHISAIETMKTYDGKNRCAGRIKLFESIEFVKPELEAVVEEVIADCMRRNAVSADKFRSFLKWRKVESVEETALALQDAEEKADRAKAAADEEGEIAACEGYADSAVEEPTTTALIVCTSHTLAACTPSIEQKTSIEPDEIKSEVEIAEEEYREANAKYDYYDEASYTIGEKLGEHREALAEAEKEYRKLEGAYKRAKRPETKETIRFKMIFWHKAVCEEKPLIEGLQMLASFVIDERVKFSDALEKATLNLKTARKKAGLIYTATIITEREDPCTHERHEEENDGAFRTIEEVINFFWSHSYVENDIVYWRVERNGGVIKRGGRVTTELGRQGYYSTADEMADFNALARKYGNKANVIDAEISEHKEQTADITYATLDEEFAAIAFRAIHYFTLDDFITPIAELRAFCHKAPDHATAKAELENWVEMATAAGIEIPAEPEIETRTEEPEVEIIKFEIGKVYKGYDANFNVREFKAIARDDDVPYEGGIAFVIMGEAFESHLSNRKFRDFRGDLKTADNFEFAVCSIWDCCCEVANFIITAADLSKLYGRPTAEPEIQQEAETSATEPATATETPTVDLVAAISAIPANSYVDAIALILANYPNAHSLDDEDYIRRIMDRYSIWTPYKVCNGRRLYKATIEQLEATIETTNARYAEVNEEISQLDTSTPIWRIKELRDKVFETTSDIKYIASNRFAEIAVAISELDEDTNLIFDEELAARLASVDKIYSAAKQYLDQKHYREPVDRLTKLYKQITAEPPTETSAPVTQTPLILPAESFTDHAARPAFELKNVLQFARADFDFTGYVASRVAKVPRWKPREFT